MHIEYSVPCYGASSGELELSTCILSTVYLAVVLHLESWSEVVCQLTESIAGRVPHSVVL